MEVLGHTHEGDVMLFEDFHQPGKVEQGAAQPVDAVGHDTIDLPGLDVGQEAL
jgi:hypothetical protein